jgi:hypothetical protein
MLQESKDSTILKQAMKIDATTRSEGTNNKMSGRARLIAAERALPRTVETDRVVETAEKTEIQILRTVGAVAGKAGSIGATSSVSLWSGG